MAFSYTVFQGEGLNLHIVWQVVRYGGRGQPTASGSGRCLPETSSRGSEDAGNGRRAERSAAE
ncbi:unknown [Bacteroides sp. CAG:770]|nr:unknown [Bacteroides sp. CAG:770]